MMNRVVLVGRLTKDPELRFTSSGIAVATFTLAVNRTFTNQQGEREADFINIVVWRRPAENVANYLRKGSLAGVDGRIQTRHYDGQDGRRVYVTEVVADSVQFLDTRKSEEPKKQEQRYTPDPGASFKQNNDMQDPFAQDGQIDINDDDLPF